MPRPELSIFSATVARIYLLLGSTPAGATSRLNGIFFGGGGSSRIDDV